MDREYGLDAGSLLHECPNIYCPARYGWLRFQWRGGAASPEPADRVALTVAGMVLLPSLADEVEVFLHVLGLLVRRVRSIVPLANQVQDIKVSAGEVRRELSEWILEEAELDSIYDTLIHEPPGWPVLSQREDELGKWTISRSSLLRRWCDIHTARDYLDRVFQIFAPPVPEPPPMHASALALPEAIDYLNAVWRLHASDPLLELKRAEGAAKLSLPCSTSDEFESRLSALCGILGQLKLPGRESPAALGDLRDYLRPLMGAEESYGRADAAISELQAMFGLRAWRQHPGAEARGPRAMKTLGIQLPADDWGDAWEHLRTRAIAALNTLREEVDGLEPYS